MFRRAKGCVPKLALRSIVNVRCSGLSTVIIIKHVRVFFNPTQPTDIQTQPNPTHYITRINPTQPTSHKITKTSMVAE